MLLFIWESDMSNFDRRKCFTSVHTFSGCDTASSFTGKGNEMTAAYAEGGRKPLFKCVLQSQK